MVQIMFDRQTDNRLCLKIVESINNSSCCMMFHKVLSWVQMCLSCAPNHLHMLSNITPYIISYMLITLNCTNLAVQVKSSPPLKVMRTVLLISSHKWSVINYKWMTIKQRQCWYLQMDCQNSILYHAQFRLMTTQSNLVYTSGIQVYLLTALSHFTKKSTTYAELHI